MLATFMLEGKTPVSKGHSYRFYDFFYYIRVCVLPVEALFLQALTMLMISSSLTGFRNMLFFLLSR